VQIGQRIVAIKLAKLGIFEANCCPKKTNDKYDKKKTNDRLRLIMYSHFFCLITSIKIKNAQIIKKPIAIK
jgi:hypothetical protein